MLYSTHGYPEKNELRQSDYWCDMAKQGAWCVVAILGSGEANGVTGRSKEGHGVWVTLLGSWAAESGRAWLSEIGTHLTPVLS